MNHRSPRPEGHWRAVTRQTSEASTQYGPEDHPDAGGVTVPG